MGLSCEIMPVFFFGGSGFSWATICKKNTASFRKSLQDPKNLNFNYRSRNEIRQFQFKNDDFCGKYRILQAIVLGPKNFEFLTQFPQRNSSILFKKLLKTIIFPKKLPYTSGNRCRTQEIWNFTKGLTTKFVYFISKNNVTLRKSC